MVKILIVTSKYQPQMCGIGDYSLLLAEHLRELSYSVDVFSSGKSAENKGTVGVFRCSSWSMETIKYLAQLISEENYTHVLLQYTPMGFSRKGAFPPIALLPRLIRKTAPHCKVITTLHELFYVTNLSELARIPRNLTIGTSQRFLLAEVIMQSKALVVTTQERYQFITHFGRLLGQHKANIHEIPVGTNIVPVQFSELESEQLKAKLGIAGKFILGTFSKTSDPKMLLSALAECRNNGLDACLLAVGTDFAYFRDCSLELSETLSPYIICTGKVSSEEVSQYLQVMHLYLLPLLDGISVRRTTLLAALAHGLPIVGTWGRSTDPWMCKSTAFRLMPAGNKTAFANAVLKVSVDPEQQQSLRREAHILFAERFTWATIARSYQEIIETLS